MALDCFAEAQRKFEANLGPHHPYTLGAMVYRAHCYSQVGQLDQAAQLYARVLHFGSATQSPQWTQDIKHRLKWLQQQQSSEPKQP